MTSHTPPPLLLQQATLAASLAACVPRLRLLCLLKTSLVGWGVQLEDLALPCLTHLSLPAAALHC